MLYTVGHRESYTEALKEPNPRKLGPYGDPSSEKNHYDGGIAFLTPKDAKAFLDEEGISDYGIYAMDGELEDTYTSPSGWLAITRDLPLLKEVTVSKVTVELKGTVKCGNDFSNSPNEPPIKPKESSELEP